MQSYNVSQQGDNKEQAIEVPKLVKEKPPLYLDLPTVEASSPKKSPEKSPDKKEMLKLKLPTQK